jgi:hypothetical protein
LSNCLHLGEVSLKKERGFPSGLALLETIMKIKTDAVSLYHDLAHFTGTEWWYRHPLFNNVLFTDGVQHLAQKAGAYWLVECSRQ